MTFKSVGIYSEKNTPQFRGFELKNFLTEECVDQLVTLRAAPGTMWSFYTTPVDNEPVVIEWTAKKVICQTRHRIFTMRRKDWQMTLEWLKQFYAELKKARQGDDVYTIRGDWHLSAPG